LISAGRGLLKAGRSSTREPTTRSLFTSHRRGWHSAQTVPRGCRSRSVQQRLSYSTIFAQPEPMSID